MEGITAAQTYRVNLADRSRHQSSRLWKLHGAENDWFSQRKPRSSVEQLKTLM